MARLVVSLVAILVASLAGLVHAGTASAQQEQPCSASINGVPADGRTIKVDKDSDATIVVTAPGGPTTNRVYLEFFSKRWEIGPPSSGGGQWSATVPVRD